MAAGVLAMSAASTAKATQVFFADFDGLNGGASATNYTGLTDFVIDSGALDLVKSGDFGIQCAGGAGSCIDLEGSNGTYVRMTTANAFAAKAGDIVTISADISGSQRPDADPFDFFFVGIRYGALMDVGPITAAPPWIHGVVDFTNPSQGSLFTQDVLADSGFQTYTLSFVAPQDMMVKIRIGGGTPAPANAQPRAPNDSGALLDNVRLDITTPGGVPEPSTWAMMLLGFGGLGAALRRRRGVRLGLGEGPAHKA